MTQKFIVIATACTASFLSLICLKTFFYLQIICSRLSISRILVHFNTVKLHINIPLMCLVFIPVSPLVMCRVLLQCRVCCCNLCIYCCVSWVWWKLAGSWFSGQRMCLFLERWIPTRRSWEELQETGSSWRTDFDLLSLRFQRRFLFCFPITVVCHQIRYSQRCSTHKFWGHEKKEQRHNIMSPVLLQCACVSAGLWGAVSEWDSVNTKCFLSKCWRICLCWSCSVCARPDVPGYRQPHSQR